MHYMVEIKKKIKIYTIWILKRYMHTSSAEYVVFVHTLKEGQEG